MQENQYTEQELKLIRKNRREKVAVVFLLSILFIFVIGAFIIYPGIYSDAKCEEFSTQLFRCDLPQGTRIIETYSATENFAPTGDNMCFLAIALVESALTREELESYYKAQQFRSIGKIDGEYYGAVLEVAKAEEGAFAPSFLSEWHSVTFDYVEGNQDLSNLYYVVIYDQTELPNFFFGAMYG